MKQFVVILNPTAGNGNGLKSLPAIRRLMDEQKLDYDLFQTECIGHAIELARKAAADGVPVVVSAGGDGTINEVLNGMLQAEQEGQPLPLLGVLCAGRGNDFTSGPGIPETLEEGVQALVKGHHRRIDIGRVRGGIFTDWRYFCNVVGIGFDAITTIEVHKMPRWGGFAAFLAGVLKTIFLYSKGPLATIEFSGQTLTQRSLMISIMNGRRLGGGFIMAPDSKPDDGLFDLCIAEQMSPWRILRLIPHFFKGTQGTQPGIRMGQAARITVTAQDGPLPAQTDGEIFSTEGRKIEVELIPSRIEVICRGEGG